MFNFWRQPQPTHPSPAITKALTDTGLPVGLNPATLEVVRQRGLYAGRKVDRFRVFDPQSSAVRAIPVRLYVDLDGHPELVMGAGHVEHDGAVVMKPSPYNASPLPARLRANRDDHVFDEQFVREYTQTPGPAKSVSTGAGNVDQPHPVGAQ